jgi:3-hydroxybutyryl-CoA dehydratase
MSRDDAMAPHSIPSPVDPAGQLYLEDFRPGQRFEGPTRTLDREAFRAFATLTGDAHPIHYDPQYAARSRFGRPVAHGLLLAACGALGATTLSARLEASMIAFLEQGMRFLAPVCEGDTVRCEFEVQSASPGRDPGRGVLRLAVRLLDPLGKVLAEGHHAYLIATRPRENVR